MSTSIITALIVSISALLGAVLGAVLGAFIQLRIMKASQSFQLHFESGKRQMEFLEKEKEIRDQYLLKAHQSISMVARKFSLTSLDIEWRSGMTEKEYDKTYLDACAALDEARAICDLFLPDAAEPLEKIYGQMNIFWGSFKEVLRLSETGAPYPEKEKPHQEATHAAMEIARFAHTTKIQLSMLARTR